MRKVDFPSRLKKVIKDNVITPILTHPYTAAWHKEVASKFVSNNIFEDETKNFHRNSICMQGQADFRSGNAGLTAEDVSLLYCYYFFQMHFTSSVAIYLKYQDELVSVFQKSNTIRFIDIGCGPYTSGLAFLCFTASDGVYESIRSRKDVVRLEYYGIDTAPSMLTLGNAILVDYQSLLTGEEFKYEVVSNDADYNSLSDIVRNAGTDDVIIINCCYFFASDTLDIGKFTAVIQNIVNNNPNAKILFFYQNARNYNDRFVSKYHNFKRTISGLTAGTDIEELTFSYDDEFEAAKSSWPTLRLPVRFQLLKNY